MIELCLKGSLWLPCWVPPGTGTGGCQKLSEKDVTVTLGTQCCSPHPCPHLSISVEDITLCDICSKDFLATWDPGPMIVKALRGFSGFKSTAGVPNIVITDQGAQGLLCRNYHVLGCSVVVACVSSLQPWFHFAWEPDLTKLEELWLWAIPWAVLILYEVHFCFPLY